MTCECGGVSGATWRCGGTPALSISDKPKRTPCIHPSERYMGEGKGGPTCGRGLSEGCSGDWCGRFDGSLRFRCAGVLAFPCCIAVLHGCLHFRGRCDRGLPLAHGAGSRSRGESRGVLYRLYHSAFFPLFYTQYEPRILSKLPIQAIPHPPQPRPYPSPPRTYPGM